ncbi:MAG: ATP-dependent helicase, partial [Propionibacteriaceae bacterium]
RRTARAEQQPVADVALHRTLATLRKELNTLVAQHARLNGTPHSHVHAQLRRECGGPTLAECSAAQVSQRLAKIKSWR